MTLATEVLNELRMLDEAFELALASFSASAVVKGAGPPPPGTARILKTFFMMGAMAYDTSYNETLAAFRKGQISGEQSELMMTVLAAEIEEWRIANSKQGVTQ